MAVLRRDRTLVVLVLLGIGLALVLGVVALVDAVTSDGAEGALVGSGTTTRHTITVDGRARTYLRYIPDELPDGPVPLVVGLHGVSGSGSQFQGTSGLDRVADDHGAVVVYPDGITGGRKGDLSTWNAGNCCGPSQRDHVDDVRFVAAVIDQVIDAIETSRPIDETRVLAIGYSNGAMLAYRLACELSDTITGIGPIGGPMGVMACQPTKPVSAMHVHGAADRTVPPEGWSMGGGIYNTHFRSARLSTLMLAGADGCPDEALPSMDGANRVERWTPCAGGAEVVLTLLEGAGHDYPGPAVTDEIYRFLADHPRLPSM